MCQETKNADSGLDEIKRRAREIERERQEARAQNAAAYWQGQAEGQAATASMDPTAKNAAPGAGATYAELQAQTTGRMDPTAKYAASSGAALGYYVPPSLAEMCAKRIAHVQAETHQRIVHAKNEQRDFERLQELSGLLERNPETARILDLIGALNLR